ncbi:rhodanese-like domain-containing protein [bacterium]|nr:rhodanese-like domain-containing protein [candidate division CSSED10-310 bacterium]
MRSAVLEAIALGALAMVVAVAYNAGSAAPLPYRGEWEDPTVPNPGGPCKPQAESGEFDDIISEYQAWDALFVDARSREQYLEGHIRGAVSLPVGDAGERLGEFMEFYPPDMRLVIYCTGEGCHDSHELADFLRIQGYFNVKVYRGGYADWTERGKPVREGEEP